MNVVVAIAASLGLAAQTAPPPAPPTPSSAPSTTPASAAIVVDGAWIRQPPPGAKMLGGYLRLKNPGSTVVKVVGATTSLSPRAELHTHLRVDGMMKMRQVPFIEVPAGGEVVLQPGGLHLMVMQLKEQPKEGDVVDVTLQLEGGGSVAVKVPVRREAPAPAVPAAAPVPVPASPPSGW